MLIRGNTSVEVESHKSWFSGERGSDQRKTSEFPHEITIFRYTPTPRLVIYKTVPHGQRTSGCALEAYICIL